MHVNNLIDGYRSATCDGSNRKEYLIDDFDPGSTTILFNYGDFFCTWFLDDWGLIACYSFATLTPSIKGMIGKERKTDGMSGKGKHILNKAKLESQGDASICCNWYLGP